MRSEKLAVSLVISLLLSKIALAADPAPFARLTARLVLPGKNPALVQVLEETEAGKSLLSALAGPRSRELESGLWTKQSIDALRTSRDEGLARSLDRRLDIIEESWVSRLERNPRADFDSVLGELGAEFLRFERDTQRGGITFMEPAPAGSATSLARARDGFLRGEPAFQSSAVLELKQAVIRLSDIRPELELSHALAIHDRLIALRSELRDWLPETAVYSLLSNPEIDSSRAVLLSLFVNLERLETTAPALTVSERFKAAARIALKGRLSPALAGNRIDFFLKTCARNGGAEERVLRKLLGELSLEEVNQMVHGGDPLRPSAESLLGKYIKQTGASRQEVEFPVYHDDGSSSPGPKRLVVAVSQESLPVFKSLFTREEFFTVTGHAYLTHNGRVNAYNMLDGEFRMPSTEFTPMPWVQLSSTEGQRLTQYMRFFKKYADPGVWGTWNTKRLQFTPWSLEGYCATGGYMGCTRWIGDLPIGDTRVMEYSFPGPLDASAVNLYGAAAVDPRPRVQRLAPYEHPDPLVHQVWKVPGNMQFAEAIGLKEENLKANFTNPGWLIATLLGPAPVERVPVVFVVRANHRDPFPAAWTPRYESRM